MFNLIILKFDNQTKNYKQQWLIFYLVTREREISLGHIFSNLQKMIVSTTAIFVEVELSNQT